MRSIPLRLLALQPPRRSGTPPPLLAAVRVPAAEQTPHRGADARARLGMREWRHGPEPPRGGQAAPPPPPGWVGRARPGRAHFGYFPAGDRSWARTPSAPFWPLLLLAALPGSRSPRGCARSRRRGGLIVPDQRQHTKYRHLRITRGRPREEGGQAGPGVSDGNSRNQQIVPPYPGIAAPIEIVAPSLGFGPGPPS